MEMCGNELRSILMNTTTNREYNDSILGDKGFISNALEEQLEVICPKKKPPNRELTSAETRSNKLIELERKDIEGIFGTLTRKFKSLQMYTKGLAYFDFHLRNCCALYNFDTFLAAKQKEKQKAKATTRKQNQNNRTVAANRTKKALTPLRFTVSPSGTVINRYKK